MPGAEAIGRRDHASDGTEHHPGIQSRTVRTTRGIPGRSARTYSEADNGEPRIDDRCCSIVAILARHRRHRRKQRAAPETPDEKNRDDVLHELIFDDDLVKRTGDRRENRVTPIGTPISSGVDRRLLALRSQTGGDASHQHECVAATPGDVDEIAGGVSDERDAAARVHRDRSGMIVAVADPALVR